MADSNDPPIEVVSAESQRDYLSVIFRRCVLALAGSRVPDGAVFQREMLEELVIIAEQHLIGLISHLSRISHMQRRTSPSIADVALLLNLNQLNVVDLAREASLTPAIDETGPVSTLNSLYFDPTEADLPPQSLPFFERAHQLVAPSRKRPSYIPNWMPQLPADHTYMHTASYSSQVRDLRQVRVSLVEEGRLAERALQRLLGDKGSSSIIDLRPPETPATQKMVIVGNDDVDDMDVDAKPTSGNDRYPSVHTREPTEEPPDADSATSRATSVDVGSVKGADAEDGAVDDKPVDDKPEDGKPEDGEPEDDRPSGHRPLKLSLHMGGAKSQTPQGAEPAESSHDQSGKKKRLSLKLSLGKSKKRKEPGVLGKRPRSMDIVRLARQRSKHDRNASDDEDSGNKRPDTATDPDMSSFQAALSSFVR